jgi:hypothetical protein
MAVGAIGSGVKTPFYTTIRGQTAEMKLFILARQD